MVDNDVLLSNRRKAIPAEISDAFGKARIIGREDEVGPLVDDQLLSVIEAENAIGRKHVRRRRIEFFHQEAPQVGRHCRIDPEEDGMTAPPSFQRRLEETDQILGFLFDLDLTVAQQPKDALRHDGKTREQMIEKKRDHLLDRQKPDSDTRQTNEAIDRGWDQGQRLKTNAVADPLKLECQAEPAIGDKRKWMSRVERQRSQDRKDLCHKTVFEPLAITRFQIGW